MNRADRRAIKFGRAFSEYRRDYQEFDCYRPFVGIDAELYAAYHEEDANTLGWTDTQDINWMDSMTYPHRWY